MPKDISNIFKLGKETLALYKDKEFDDCTPGAMAYAECLKCSILTKETPYVLLLEDNFGMGKTHFSTRFAYYLRNCDIDTIYFSAWENDYIEQPFVSFSSEIIKYFQQKSLTKKLKDKFGDVSKSIYALVSNLLKSTSISASVNIGFTKADCSIDMEKVICSVEDFIQCFVKKDDYLINFKKLLKSFIEYLPNHKLVIIIDELDRCRPDYAMKTLEIIKHFFDIEGLFIIVPTNQKSLKNAVKALYGIDDNDNKNAESYINKFFTDKLDLYKPDYLKIVKEKINEKTLKTLIESGKITLGNDYKSLSVLQNNLAKFGAGFKLTLREVNHAADCAIYLCSHIQKKLDCEYLAFVICSRLSRIENNNCRIQHEHPFSAESQKKELLTLKIPVEVYTLNRMNYQQDFERYYPFFRNRTFTSYAEFDKFYEHFLNNPKNFDVYYEINPNYGVYTRYKYNFSALESYLNNKNQEIEEYKKTWASDDNDFELKKYYDTIVIQEPKVHTDKLTL